MATRRGDAAPGGAARDGGGPQRPGLAPLAEADDLLRLLPADLYRAVIAELDHGDRLRLAAAARWHRRERASSLGTAGPAVTSRAPDPALLQQLRHSFPSPGARGRRRLGAAVRGAALGTATALGYALALPPLTAVHLGAWAFCAAHNAALGPRSRTVRRSPAALAPTYVLARLREWPAARREAALDRDPARWAALTCRIQARLAKSLARAIDAGDHAGVRQLLTLGARVERPGPDGLLPLRRATAAGEPAAPTVVSALRQFALLELDAATDPLRIEALVAALRPSWPDPIGPEPRACPAAGWLARARALRRAAEQTAPSPAGEAGAQVPARR